MVELRKVDSNNIWKIIKLSVNNNQFDFVATNTESILEAYTTITSGGVALPFGIYRGDTLVGFVMFGYGANGDDEPDIAAGNYCIWRFMIDKTYQGQGLGKKAMQASIEYLRSEPCGRATYCWLSYEPENIVAKALYNSMGFIENGEMCDEEIVAVLRLLD
ncbi:GNAT family N-acetyltransferase [Clostridium intestinale]|jgi:diamine N-acetyltransferase|uniref:Acetyltransferase n=1 Tax=Clostridium intestinale URNW TaxID=1294142 RepID=U2NMS5_9CLOT|nr:GNAT family N-acetyltransferase [Clostridium intestinale]ERK30151.1 acetyltransferase [Clostridium intestinale URNW]